MNKIAFWCPFISVGGVVKLIINSSISLARYSKDKYSIEIISFFGEWYDYYNTFSDHNIRLTNFFPKKFKKYFPIGGYFFSRVTFILIFLFSLIPLFKYLEKKKPDFLVAHLLTSVPIFLYNFFNFETKLILRISGMPKLNFIRKYFWKISNRNISLVVVPTIETYKDLVESKIFPKNKVFVVNDPIINVSEINKLIKESEEKKTINFGKNYFLSIGRLTKQKNQKILIKAFNEFNKYNKNFELVILGEGELRSDLESLVNKLGLVKKVHFIGQVKNVFGYIKKSTAVISASLWEECSYVLIEAAYTNLIIHSNCKSGPKEFIENNQCGYLFNKNSYVDLANTMLKFLNENNKQVYQKKLNAKIKTKEYTCFSHYKKFSKVLMQ